MMIDQTSFGIDSEGPAVDSDSQTHLSSAKLLKMNLKTQLSIYLEDKEITANQLAKLSGVSKQVISLWMSGASPAKLAQIKKVAEVLGTTIDHLCFGKGLEKSTKSASVDSIPEDEWLSGIFELKFRKLKR